MFRTIAPYIPPVLTTAILGTLAIQEFENLAPEKFKIKIKPLLGRKASPPPEFSGDASPQRGVFNGGDRSYSAILVVQGNQQTERKQMARAAAKACLKWNNRDVDIALGFGPKVWDACKALVPLGNVGHTQAVDFKLKDRSGEKSQRPIINTGGDVIVHVKADTEGRCVEVVKSVLKELESTSLAWTEDLYGYKPEHASGSLMCPTTQSIGMTSASLCKIACVPKVGSSYMLFQRWDDDNETMKGKAKPPANHSERVKGMDQDGNKLQIVRHTARTGRLGTRSGDDKTGMLFVAYSVDPRIYEYMLDRIAGKRGGSGEDTTMLYSKCTRSQLFYVPSQAQINALGSVH
jgi:deferrochelatase/peroxidase EfeB